MITVTSRRGRQTAILATTTRIYVGRGSPLGNPFIITANRPREAAIALYEEWLKAQPGDSPAWTEIRRIARVSTLSPSGINVELECYCAPKPCHADVIKRIIEEGDF